MSEPTAASIRRERIPKHLDCLPEESLHALSGTRHGAPPALLEKNYMQVQIMATLPMATSATMLWSSDAHIESGFLHRKCFDVKAFSMGRLLGIGPERYVRQRELHSTKDSVIA